MFYPQLFDMVNLGIVILDRDLKVQRWNRWLEMHTRVSADQIIGAGLIDFFPNLNNSWFTRNCRSVFNFGNFAFFSQKLHNYIIPISPAHHFDPEFKYMQQNCTIGPLYNEKKEIEYIYMIIQDATEVAAYEAKLLDISTRDSLTEAFNRRYLEAKLRNEIERHKRYKRSLSLIMLDIDDFKGVNYKYGLQAGDSILIQLASILSNRLRVVDTVARYGGEEFCIILPETDMQSAHLVANQLKSLVEKTSFNFAAESIKITVSLGIAEADGQEVNMDALIQKVNESLLAAQKQGPGSVFPLSQ